MDNANGYPQQDNSQPSFEQSFMQSVSQQPQQPSAVQPVGNAVEPPKRNNKPLIIGVIVLAMIIVGSAIALIIIRNSNYEYIPPITDEEMDGSVNEGSWKMYDENRNVVAVRITCSTPEREYAFFKDGSYVLTEGGVLTEGTYTIGDGIIRLSNGNGGYYDAQYDFKNFSLNGESYSCREYNDA